MLCQKLGAFYDQEARHEAEKKIEGGRVVPPENRVVAPRYEKVSEDA
jgi:hypothetical protein